VRELDLRFATSGPVLEQYFRCRAKRHFIMGPLGSGKTFTSAMKALDICISQAPDEQGVRRTTGLVTRTNMTDLEASALKDWLELTEEKLGGALGKFNWASPAHHTLDFDLPDGTRVASTIWFMGLDDPDGIMKVRGMPLTWAWLNETKDIPFGLVKMIFGRCGRYPQIIDGGPTWYGLFGDTNMPHAGHWMYEFAENQRPEGWEFFKQAGGVVKVEGEWKDNPNAENLVWLPKSYYRDQLAGSDEAFISVYLGANYGFAMSGNPVYPEYSDATHCREISAVPGLPIRIGCDWGNTPAAIFGQKLPNGAWRWLSEVVTEDFGIVRFAEEVVRHQKENYAKLKVDGVTGDPSGEVMQGADTEERSVFQIMRAHGVEVEPAHTNDPVIRREAAAKFMKSLIDGQPGFLISPRCKTARVGLAGGFKYKKIRSEIEGSVRPKRDKNIYSHPVEAGEYMMMGAGEGRAIVRKERTGTRKMEADADYAIFGT
jgi:hypothetical protein